MLTPPASLPPLPNSSHEQVEQPKPEDVECMCKLLATVGGLLDSSTKTVKNFGGGSKPVATKVGGAPLGADAWLQRTAAVDIAPARCKLPLCNPCATFSCAHLHLSAQVPSLTALHPPPSTRPQDVMNVYFTRIDQLARNEAALDSRHRFMLLDLIEQRRNRWRPRKEVRQKRGSELPRMGWALQMHGDASCAVV